MGEVLGSNKNPLTREQVIDAATECLEHFGVAKTSMIDVARKLGVTRQTIHRLFETRAILLEAVAEVRIQAAAKRLVSMFATYDDIEETLVYGTLQSLAVGRSDKLLCTRHHRMDIRAVRSLAVGQELLSDQQL